MSVKERMRMQKKKNKTHDPPIFPIIPTELINAIANARFPEEPGPESGNELLTHAMNTSTESVELHMIHLAFARARYIGEQCGKGIDGAGRRLAIDGGAGELTVK